MIQLYYKNYISFSREPYNSVMSFSQSSSSLIDTNEHEPEFTTTSLGKRTVLRSKLFTEGLCEERELPEGHKKKSTHREVQCLNCP